MTDTTYAEIAEQQSTPLWEDYVEIFFAPRDVFERRVNQPRWVWGLLVLVILMGISNVGVQAAIAPVIDAQFTQVLDRAGPEITPEQVAQMREGARVFGPISFVATLPVVVILLGIVIWGVGKIFGSRASYPLAMLIATYSQFPRILQQLAMVAQGLVLDLRSYTSIAQLSLGPARFMDSSDATDPVVAIAARIDPFMIWSAILVAIGLQVMGKLNRTESWVAAGVIWAVGAIPILLGSVVGR